MCFSTPFLNTESEILLKKNIQFNQFDIPLDIQDCIVSLNSINNFALIYVYIDKIELNNDYIIIKYFEDLIFPITQCLDQLKQQLNDHIIWDIPCNYLIDNNPIVINSTTIIKSKNLKKSLNLMVELLVD